MSDRSRVFRRRVTMVRPTSSTVVAELEDHIHHVEVTIEHDGRHVLAIAGRGVRLPWSLCPGAAAALDEFVGSPIGVRPAVPDMSAHCTHMLDCASIAVRFAGLDTPSRTYDLSVTGWASSRATGIAQRDDGRELVLQTDGAEIVEPSGFRGQTLGAGFTQWTTEQLDPDVAEMALLLRRAIWMRHSLGVDLDRVNVLSESGVSPASCFASQPERIHIATRNRGSSLRELGRRLA